MMKKILRMLLLGFLTFTVLSPSVVTAAEDQSVKEPSSSVYSEIDGIAPLATPYIEEITLDNGESYELTKQCLLFPNRYGNPTIIYGKIRSVSSEREAFSLQPIASFALNDEKEKYHYASEADLFAFNSLASLPEEIETKEAGIRITNYSSGPAKYRIGINICHHPEDMEFDLG